MLNGDKLRHYAQNNGYILLCLGFFLVAYGALLLLATETAASLGLIYVAHVASNMVFALGTYSVLAYFPAENVSAASANAWRWQTLTSAIAIAIAAVLASRWGALQSLYFVSPASLAAVALILMRYRHR